MNSSTSPGQTTTRWTGWGFVAAQFALLAVVILAPAGEAWSAPDALDLPLRAATWIGIAVMVVAALGLGRGLTATPVPNAHARLQIGGLFRFVRHPIYAGLLLFVVGHVARTGSWVALVAGVLLVVLINLKARWEEARLRERFADYAAYAERTPRFVPRPARFLRPAGP